MAFSSLVFACVALVLAGCDSQSGAVVAGTPGAAGAGEKRSAPKAQLVEVVPVLREEVSLVRELTGSLRTERVHRVFTQEEGRLLALPWREGDVVNAGEVLMRLDPALLEAQLARADAVRRDAASQLAQFERLGRSRAVAAEEIRRARTELEVARAELQLLRTRRGFTTERAPFAGVVSERLAEQGDFVSKGTHLLTLADPATLRVDLDLGERLLALVRRGTPVSVALDAVDDSDIAARVERVHPALDARTRQGRVEIVADRGWPAAARAGQLARVTLEAPLGPQLTLPPFAVRRDVEGEFVYRVAGEARNTAGGAGGRDDKVSDRASDTVGDSAGETGEATAERVNVRIGRRFADRVVVRDGLAEGDRVVVRGFMGLRPGKAVRWREALRLVEEPPLSEPPPPSLK